MPEVLEYNGQQYSIPDEWDDRLKSEYISALYKSKPGDQPSSQAVQQGLSPTHPDNLQFDPDFVRASQILYKAQKNEDIKDPKAAAEWGVDHMRFINNNMTFGMALDATRLIGADQDYKKAFLYALDKYDKSDYTAKGMAKGLLYNVTDPANLVGLTTLGLGFGAKAAGKQVTKEGLKAALKASIANGAIEGALFTGASDALRQQAEVNAEGRSGIDWTQAGGAALIGGAIGAPLGAAGHYVGRALTKDAPTIHTDAPTAVSEDLARVVPEEASVSPGGPHVRQDEPMPAQALLPTAQEEPVAALKPADALASDAMSARSPRRSLAEREAAGERIDYGVRSALEETPTQDLPKVIEEIKNSPERYGDWKAVTQEFAEATKTLDVEQKGLMEAVNRGDAAALDRLEEINLRRDLIKPEDTRLSSTSGDILGNRANKDYFNTNENRGLSPTEILKEKGIDPKLATQEQKLAANNEYIDRYNNYLANQERDAKIKALEDEADRAIREGDYAKALQLKEEKQHVLDAKLESTGQADSRAKKFTAAATEWMISGMFGPGTVFANTVSSGANMVAHPLARWLTNNPTSKVELNRVMSTYGAMFTQQQAALKLAMLAFKYEESMTGKDYTRNAAFYTHAIPGKLGGAIRFFPRLLAASDEYLARLTYSGYVQGTAAAQATARGMELGLTGNALSSFVKKEVKEAMEKAWTNPGTDSIIDRLKAIGVRKGYSGEKLTRFVKNEMEKNGGHLLEASEKIGESYTKDILFKREFSGEGLASQMAKGFEDLLNQAPAFRIIQPFFRTIVRVFEEGARLTPGLNLAIMTNDLRGVNGEARRARAMGEAFLSQAIAVKFLMDYSANRITGSGPDKPGERKEQQDAGFQPYSFYTKDGDAFGFKNLDPFSTPLKIMANGMDRLRQIQLRQAQGEYLKAEESLVFDSVKAAFVTLVSAVKDANMTAGLNDIAQMAGTFGDEKSDENKWGKLAARKLNQFVPGLIAKYEAFGDPSMAEPATFSQVLASKLPGDWVVPKGYNALGDVRTNTDPLGALTGLYHTSKEDRTSKDPKKAAVLSELARISKETNAHFEAPSKHPLWPGIDLRETHTSDGKETLYDRWNKIYSRSPVVEKLHEQLVERPTRSTGSTSVDGVKAQVARQLINGYRNWAMEQLIKSEAEGHQALRQQELRKGEVLKGKHDARSSLWAQ